jgi:hypothetical protein
MKPSGMNILGQVENFGAEPESTTRLSISAGNAAIYRIAQLDDYSNLPRKDFCHRPPLSFSLSARVSSNHLPGTWGFGFWNDPFAMGIGIKGSGFRLPALPRAAWFFYGSPRNDLSFQAVSPANGLMTSVFSSAKIPSILLPLAIPGLSVLPIRPAARLIRRFASHFIRDTFTQLAMDFTAWHSYRMVWQSESVQYEVDDEIVFTSHFSPRPPLGLVIWIDNQYTAFSSTGTIHFGTENNPEPAWLEFRAMKITKT